MFRTTLLSLLFLLSVSSFAASTASDQVRQRLRDALRGQIKQWFVALHAKTSFPIEAPTEDELNQQTDSLLQQAMARYDPLFTLPEPAAQSLLTKGPNDVDNAAAMKRNWETYKKFDRPLPTLMERLHKQFETGAISTGWDLEVARRVSDAHLFGDPTPSSTPTRQAMDMMVSQEREREKKIWDSLLATPISFYGKVIDEKNDPIADANVEASLSDHLGFGDTTLRLKTDKAGLFHAAGHGLGVVILVTKDGYYHLQQSDGNFTYAKAAGHIDPHPDANSPAVFVLRKVGRIEPLIVKEGRGSLAKDGTPSRIDLQSGRNMLVGQEDMRIECWTDDRGIRTNSNDRFDWRCRLSVEGGGLIERTGEFDFEAPDHGYSQFVEINMPKALGAKWRSFITREYFVQLPNGAYARVRFVMNAGGRQTFALTSYLNPKPGSRSLEHGQPPPGGRP